MSDQTSGEGPLEVDSNEKPTLRMSVLLGMIKYATVLDKIKVGNEFCLHFNNYIFHPFIFSKRDL